ncbi:MAG: hypothetical protein FWB90_00765 [Fibromonadales bacterium]|nr:hypothetical protein [Fibromonadales bacterium]
MENKQDDIVWHYTKIDVLEKIFSPKRGKQRNKNVNIRFTASSFLKDPSEGLVLKEFLEKNKRNVFSNLPVNCKERVSNERIDKKRHEDGFNYIFSTTRLEDSFAFWNKEYAGWDGVAIGIKR